MDDKKKVVITVKLIYRKSEICGYYPDAYCTINDEPFEMNGRDFDAWSVQYVLEAMGYEVEIYEIHEYED